MVKIMFSSSDLFLFCTKYSTKKLLTKNCRKIPPPGGFDLGFEKISRFFRLKNRSRSWGTEIPVEKFIFKGNFEKMLLLPIFGQNK